MKTTIQIIARAVCTIVLCSTDSAYGEEEKLPITNHNISSVEDKSANEKHKEKQAPTLSSVEKAVIPITRWMEKKIQNAPFIKPSAHPQKQAKPIDTTGLSLREAISAAQERHEGTILSANRVNAEDTYYFSIKILSADGVIKIVQVDGKPKQKDIIKKQMKNENTTY